MAISWPERLSHRRITLREHPVQAFRTLLCEPRAEMQPDCLGNRRHIGKPPGQCLEIETGAADKDGCPPGGPDLPHKWRHVTEPFTCRIVPAGLDVAVEMMRRARLFGG